MFLGGALHIHGITTHRARKKILGRPDEILRNILNRTPTYPAKNVQIFLNVVGARQFASTGRNIQIVNLYSTN